MFNIKHHDLYMQDGTDPPESILKGFMHIAENAPGAIGVHCKAGLGRTGSLIGAYLLKHYRMTAKEAIAWIRICRPGSVIGHQQSWLENHEELLWYEGNEWRYRVYGKTEIVPFLPYGIYSYESPKKEFPGLKELLANLTKRSRYRFIVKNRSKKSKTRLHQIIKNLLEKGRSKKDTKAEEKSLSPSVDETRSFHEVPPPPPLQQNYAESKNVQYLKPPPQVGTEIQKPPFNYDYPQTEYRKPIPAKMYANDYPAVANYQKPMEYFPSNYAPMVAGYDGKLQAMYSNPNSFYTESEYSQYGLDSKPVSPLQQRRMTEPYDMPKVYSEQIPPGSHDRQRSPNNLLSKSIDKNWKQNPGAAKYYAQNVMPKYPSKPMPQRTQQQEEVCAFDSRIDTISQYSRFNKGFLNKSYMNESQANSLENEYYPESKVKSYDYTKATGRPPHGFLLSPEDLKTWVETFDDKFEENPGDKSTYGLRRSSVT